MAVTLEDRESPPPAGPETGQESLPVLISVIRAGGDDPPPDDGGGPGRGRGWSPWLAVPAVVLVAALLTYLGMLSQVWANLTGAQLPGA